MPSFSSGKILMQHKKICLKINGKQSVKLKSGSINFKNYFKQLAVPFKIYVDFESVLKRIRSDDKNNASNTKKYQQHIPCSFSKPVVLYRGKNDVNKFIEAILKENEYCKKKKRWKSILLKILSCL